MTLPEIVLPKITLPFDIAVLLHPSVVHFLIAIPVVVLLLEIMNLMMKKKAVGGVSFFLLLLIALAAVGAYFTGLVDGKEAYPALSEAAKSALGEHKLLGTYLMLASFVLVFLKLLAMTGNKVLKALYIFALVGFVVIMFKQGKEGGELVYEHGMNVQAVKTLDDKIFDLEEALEEANEKTKVEAKVETSTTEVKTEAPAAVEVPTPVETPQTVPSQVVQPIVQEPTSKESISNESAPMETTSIEETVVTPTPASVQTVQSVEKAVATPTEEVIPTPQ